MQKNIMKNFKRKSNTNNVPPQATNNNNNNNSNNNSSNNKNNSSKLFKVNNLSPAKKFRMRLRKEKMQKQQQAKDDYYEHDTRGCGNNHNKPPPGRQKKHGKLHRKGRRAQMYIDAYLKSQREQQQLRQNGDVASHEETQDSSSCGIVKSTVHKTLSVPSLTSFGYLLKEQETNNCRNSDFAPSAAIVTPTIIISSSTPTQTLIQPTNSITERAMLPGVGNNVVKCCCHCACTVPPTRKMRRKPQSFDKDFTNNMHFVKSPVGGGDRNLASEVKTQITTTTHQQTLVETASDSVDFGISFNSHQLFQQNQPIVNTYHQLLPVIDKNCSVNQMHGRYNPTGGGIREMRSLFR